MALTIGGGFIKSMDLTRSWGVNPASANITVLGGGSYATGADVTLNLGGVLFSGVVTSSVPSVEDGVNINLTVADNRIKLAWDTVYGVFNVVDILEDDPALPYIQRKKRYKHIHPRDWHAQSWSYTDKPVTAREILDAIFSSETVKANFNYRGAKLNQPVYGLDANSGKKLSNVIQEISDALGVLISLEGASTLVFETKGVGTVPQPSPTNTSHRSNGSALGVDTKVRIVGDRNLYQDAPILLEPDWIRHYEKFVFKPAWIEEVKLKFSIQDNAEATARAMEITLRAYSAIAGKEYRDFSVWGDVSRMEIPVWTYISDIVFKSYRVPRNFKINNIGLHSLTLREGLLLGIRISAEGLLEYVADELYPEAKAFIAVKGQPLSMIDLTNHITLTPEKLAAAASKWRAVNNFSLDTKNHLVIFDSPMFVSNDLYVKANPGESGELQNLLVPNARAVIQPAEVCASLCFEAEKYGKWFGSGSRDGVLYAQGLNYHALMRHNTWYREITYANDSNSGADKNAEKIADSYLSGINFLQSGGYDRHGVAGMALNGAIDRVTVSVRFESGSEGEGIQERVEYAKERSAAVFQNERELERRQRTRDLFPGQSELKEEARQVRRLGQLLKGIKATAAVRMTSIDQTTQCLIGNPSPSVVTAILDTPATYPVGMPVFTDKDNKVSKDSRQFAGVLTAANTPAVAGSNIPLAPNGRVPCRVQGPVQAGDSLGVDDGEDFAKKGGKKPIGTALQDYAGSEKRVIYVRLGGGGGASVQVVPYQFFFRQKTTGSPAVPVPGQWQGRVEEKSYLMKSRKVNDWVNPLTGLSTSTVTGEINESSWFSFLPTDVVWLEWNGSAAAIKSWGKGDAWANFPDEVEISGSSYKARALIAYSFPDANGAPVVTQILDRHLLLKTACGGNLTIQFPEPYVGPYIIPT